MTEIQIIEQYNCITCIKTIILVMFVVSILNKGRTVNNKKIRNEEKKKMWFAGFLYSEYFMIPTCRIYQTI